MTQNKSKVQLSGVDAVLARTPFFYGWAVVAIVFITMGIGVNVRTSFSLLFPAILNEFGWDRATTAAAFSIGFALAAILAPIVGKLLEFVAPRFLLSVSAITVSLGLILSTIATQPWHFYLTLGVLMVGTGIVLTYVGQSMFLPNWFQRRRGLAVGIAFSGVGVGSMILMPIIQEAISADGWRDACWLMAALLLFIILPLNFFFQRKQPSDIGLYPDGDAAPDKEKTRAQQDAADPVVDHDWVSTDWTIKKAVKTGTFWWLALACSTALYVWYAVQVHQTKYLIEIGFSDLEAASALGLVGFAGVLGQIYLGNLSDRIGREWVWTISTTGFLLSSVLLLVMEYVPSAVMMYAMVILQGGLGYGVATVYGSMPADLFQGRGYGIIFGTISTLALVGGAVGPWLTGLFYDEVGNYHLAFYVIIGMSFLSILSVWLAAPRKRRLVAGQAQKRAALATAG
ncbi:MFS transporter [Sneathiella sp. CAU 1612]|uniref:MFS transporter n=1 Tax=Sneathiella sedimenti TaxID=2816034 RepID=A0ABS3F6D3_9PROT|nr:MFS transporter [Sneathiella sedimenti]MBO0334087.1 MFS transporter [Sneathiella sedimenti]